ncbi:MAG: hypothetical protein GF317_22815 [Candidatus Lokiarchaeota archaeon]|nr:hypothetical protein [Candidatus Lokiarchaeota archaeon]
MDKTIEESIKIVGSQTLYFNGLLTLKVLKFIRFEYPDFFVIQLPFSNYKIFLRDYNGYIRGKNLNFCRIFFRKKKYIITSRREFRGKPGRPRKYDGNHITTIITLKDQGLSFREIERVSGIPFRSACYLYNKYK